MNDHLTPQEMLAYVDGELSKPEMRRAEDHLHSCWSCLTDVERLKTDIATILDAQKEKFSPALSPPPRHWPSFDTLLARNLSNQPVSYWARMTRSLTAVLSPVRVLVSSGVIVVLVIFAYSMLRSKPVSAMELLHRVQVADAKRSVITKKEVIRERVHIRKKTRGANSSQSASIDTWKSAGAAYWDVSQDDSAAADLEAQYRAHDIPIGLPLSAASVDSWGKVAGGSPTVSEQGNDMDLSFSGNGDEVPGSIQRVSLIIQPETWQVKQMTLDFPDVSFEVTEGDFSLVPVNEVSPRLLAYLEPNAALPTLITPTPQPTPETMASIAHLPSLNLDQVELGVLDTLHKLHADLGEPVTIDNTGRSVEVGVWELPLERQNELRSALAGQPGVQVELTAPPTSTVKIPSALPPSPPEPSPLSDSTVALMVPPAEDDQSLLKFFGAPEKEEDFSNRALSTSTTILAHLFALRKLQQVFPASKELTLAPAERMQLNALVQDHLAAIQADIASLKTQFGPLNASFHVAALAPADVSAPMEWQSASLQALDTAKIVDHLIRALLTTDQTQVGPDAALPLINQNLSKLTGEIQTVLGAMH